MTATQHPSRPQRAPYRQVPRHRDEPTVVAPVGVLDAGSIQRLGEVVDDEPRPVILDLTGCVVTCTRTAVWQSVLHAERVSFVCERLSGRRLLRRLTGGQSPVFRSVDAARLAVDRS